MTRINYFDGSVIEFVYDGMGNRLSMTESTGTTAYTYDGLDRLTGITYPGGQAVGYTYDPAGRRTSLTYPDGNVVTYLYDAANFLVSVTDWLGNITGYEYDEAGRLVKTLHANGVVVTHTWDEANRLEELVNAVGDPAEVVLSRFEYTLDSVGNRTSVNTLDGTTTYAYDALYRLIGVEEPSGNSTAYEYDPMGNRLRMVRNGEILDHTYDAADQLTMAGQIPFAFDATGNQIGCGDDVFQYDHSNRLIRAEVGFGDVSCRSLGGIDGLRSSVSTFAYNGDGLRVRRTVMQNGEVASEEPVSLNHLVEQVGFTTSHDPEPDADHPDKSPYGVITVTGTWENVSSDTTIKDAFVEVITLTGDNWLLNANDEPGQVGATLTLDPDMTLEPGERASVDFRIGLMTPDPFDFFVDGYGITISNQQVEVQTTFTWDILATPPVVIDDGNQRYVYGLGLIVAIDAQDGSRTYLHDGLGSVVALTDENGGLVTEFRYDPFGAVIQFNNPSSNEFLFTGHQFDDATGLLYMRGRYYDPATGRFLTRDLLPGSALDSQSINKYTYARNVCD